MSERSAWTGADSREGQKVLPGLRISDIAVIAIGDAEGRLTLARDKAGWRVRERADFPADTDRVGELLVKLAELKAVQREALPESQRARLQLAEPKNRESKDAGTRLELKDEKGALLASLLLGKKVLKPLPPGTPPRGEPEATGRYVTAGSESNALLAVSDPLAQVEAKADRWIVKDLIRVDRSKTISASGSDGRPRWTLTRNGESVDWRFSDSPLKPDLQKATDVASALYWINAADVVGDAKADTGLDRPVTLKAVTFDGLTYTLRVGKPSGDSYYLGLAVAGEPPKARVPGKGEKAEDKEKKDREFEEARKKLAERVEHEKQLERWTYLVAKSSLDPLLRDRAQLLPEKKAAKKG